MRVSDLLKTLDEQDRENGLWLFTTAMLRVLFPEDSDKALQVSLSRHVEAGLLASVRKGLYANERARSSFIDKLPALVPYLKPGAINYLSQESRLSQLGRISQMPLNHLTVMTTAASQVIETRYGTVEFTRTKQPLDFILDHVTADQDTGLLVADEFLALRDLRNARRNLHMVISADEEARAR